MSSSLHRSVREVAGALRRQSEQVGTSTPGVRGADWRPAVVATVGTDGTITTTDSIVARRMEAYRNPAVGDLIHICQSGTGSWRAEGRLATTADAVGQVLWALKPVSTPRASVTVIAPDPHLLIPVSANATYLVEGWINSSSAGTHDGDLKCAISGPAGSTGRWNLIMPSTTATADPDLVRVTSTTIGGTLSVGQPGAGQYGGILTGTLITDSTAGSCTFTWSQQTSSANVTTIEAASWLRLSRIA